tara:strand:- start:1330 stop:1626 length:297 start_codon:yes stop_codon:yes gene_type:complete
MIVVHGDAPVVSTMMWHGKKVWTTGLYTEWDVVQTYADVCVMVVKELEHLRWDMTGFYVINEGNRHVAEEAVLRGAYCLNCTMMEGLWQLRDIIVNYK